MKKVMVIKLGVVVAVGLMSACAQGDTRAGGRRRTPAGSSGAGTGADLPGGAHEGAAADHEGEGEYCAHSLCEAGVALESGCDPCVAKVCEAEGRCCEVSWGEACVAAAGWLCGACGAEGCAGLPEGGVCLGELAITCEGGAIAWTECAADEACQWDGQQEQYACGDP